MSKAADADLRQICKAPLWDGVTRFGVAVSGGGDSMALLHILADCAAARGWVLEAATVDHGLRAEARDEADMVAAACRRLNVPHATLRWRGWDGQGNLQAEARAARYRLLAEWARDKGLDCVALAHTRDDQAETFLMRLSREAGVDGLAAMVADFERDGARFVRPTLGQSRAQLREDLTRRGVRWAEDPSNEDEIFDRVRARRVLEHLGELGISAQTLSGVAGNLALASHALKRCTRDVAMGIARVEAGDIVFDRAAFAATDPEIARRLLVAALTWVSVSTYPPRRAAIDDLKVSISRDRPHTVHGCIVLASREEIRITREHAAVTGAVGEPGGIWDARWRVRGPGDGCKVRALGEALKDCPDWRDTGLPRVSLLASPAIFRGETLVAAPLAGLAAGYSAEIDHPAGDFFTSILSD